MHQTQTTFYEGQRLICNGFEGSVSKVHTGTLTGMADVRVPGGGVCVSLRDLQLENPPVFRFRSTGAAYAASQTKQVPDGAILLVLGPSEYVVGVAGTWPVAVSEQPGELHVLGNNEDAAAFREKYHYAFRAAERLLPMVEAIAQANGHLNNARLPLYTDLVGAFRDLDRCRYFDPVAHDATEVGTAKSRAHRLLAKVKPLV